ncbi:MAG: DUF2183 domain-containing protein [Anaeromyxobacter sp.]
MPPAPLAAFLASLRSAVLRDGPALILPPSLARPDLAWVFGRVQRERQGRHGPAYLRTTRTLAARNWEDAPVEVTLLGQTVTARSGHDGEFEVAIPAPPGQPFPAGPLQARVSVPGASGVAVVRVVPPEAPFLLVSDLDDTLAHTHVTSLRAMLRTVFLLDARTQPVVEGMAAFYRCLSAAQPAPPLAIVSGSPVQLTRRIRRFLARHGFPPASLYLRNLGPGTLSGYKEPVLARLAERFTQPFVLVGDSGEHDPEIFSAFSRAHPGRVLAAYVRRATALAEPAARYDGLVRFDDPAEAARDAARRGLAPADAVERAFPRR